MTTLLMLKVKTVISPRPALLRLANNEARMFPKYRARAYSKFENDT